MKNRILACTIVASALAMFAAKDPVIMKINGKDIKLSEFDYLYHKNNKQQIEKETLNQYVERFVTYKLKVADAEAMGIDTTRAFVKEFNGYKADLMRPYMTNQHVQDSIEQECYERMKKNVEVCNIFLTPGKSVAEKAQKRHLIDSLYTCIQSGESISDLAVKYSEDISAQKSSGNLGFLKAGMTPNVFEQKAFTMPVGAVSQPFMSRYGWHIFKVTAIRDDPGTVLVKHILKLYPEKADDKTKAEVKAKMQAIYNRVKAGEPFEEIAKAESEDPGSAKQGGELPYFGQGQMVPEFEKVSYALKDGEMSEPFKTVYGVHIVKKIAHKGIGTFEENREAIKRMLQRDERATLAKNAKMDELKTKYGLIENPELHDYIDNAIKESNANDSVFVNTLKASTFNVFTLDNQKTCLMRDVAEPMNVRKKTNPATQKASILRLVNLREENVLSELYVAELTNENTELRNLLNEYREGMLLFEVSNRKIWDGAARDTIGLNNYFESHRSAYAWAKPKFKGIICKAKNDSVAAEAQQYFDSIKKGAADSLAAKYKGVVRVERMLVAQGENVWADNVVFAAGNDLSKENRFKAAFLCEGKIIDAPETMQDVRLQVINDYQTELEKQWVNALKKKYQVKIDKKVLKQVKE